MAQGEGRELSDGERTFRIVSCADGLGVAEIGSVCLVVWREAVNSSRFRRQQLVLDDIVARYPGCAGFVCVIEPSAPAPGVHYRKASMELVTGYGKQLRCVACVVEGDGFRAAIWRSALSSMVLLAPARAFEVKFTATVNAAAPWIAERCKDVSPERLLRAHERVLLELNVLALSQPDGSTSRRGFFRGRPSFPRK